MGEVTGYTAEAMDEISNSTVVDGTVDEDGHLILVKRDLSTIDAGPVVGDQGPPGAPGSADPSIFVATSTTRPTSGLFEGLMLYETDTNQWYFYDGTTWVYLGGAFICTSTTRPPAFYQGLIIFETDTKKLYIYDGTDWKNIWYGPRVKGFGYKNATGSDTISTTSGQDWNATSPLDVTFTKKYGATHSVIYVKLNWTFYSLATTWFAGWAGVKIAGVDWWGLFPHQFNKDQNHFEANDVLYISGLNAGFVSMRARIKKHTGSPDIVTDIGDHIIVEYEEVPVI